MTTNILQFHKKYSRYLKKKWKVAPEYDDDGVVTNEPQLRDFGYHISYPMVFQRSVATLFREATEANTKTAAEALNPPDTTPTADRKFHCQRRLMRYMGGKFNPHRIKMATKLINRMKAEGIHAEPDS